MSDARLARVVLVDDTDEIRALLRMRLRLAGGFDVVGEGRTGHEAIRLAAQHKPQLLVLDMSMPGLDGLDAVPEIGRVSPDTAVVIFSGFEEPALAKRAVDLGARAFIPKSFPIEALADRLRDVLTPAAAVRAAASRRTGPAVGWNTDGVLDEQADRFPLIFSQAAIGMATLTLTGRIVTANRSLDDLFGAEHGKGSGRLLIEFVHAGDRGDLEQAIGLLSDGSASSRLIEHRLTVESPEWVSTTLAVVRDAGGTPLYLFVQMQDVTSQRRAEAALRRSEERFRLIVESVRDYGIFMLGAHGHIATWNAGAERIKGWTAADVIGRHFRMFYTPEAQAARHPEHELEVATREGRYEEEGWRVRKDGSHFWANVVITALRDESGELVGFAKVTRDVTERERLAAARAKAADAESVLAVTAHELRSPVGVITGTASTLRQHWKALDEGDRQELLESLVSSGARIRRLVDDLLTTSRLEAGALEMQRAPQHVRGALVQAVSAATASAGKDVKVTVGAVPGDAKVLADADRLQQIIVNYVTNALSYGAPPVRVSAHRVGETVEIRVTDAGPGVPAELERALFERFAPGRDRRGTGLGLFIVRELARAQGGDAWYERTAGTTVFGVRLPAVG